MNPLKFFGSFFVVAVGLSSGVLAQSGGSMSGMNMPEHGVMKDTSTQSSQPIAAVGVVRKVDTAKRKVTLSHEAIAAIGWPAMTMDFAVAPDVDLLAVQAGQPVDFNLARSGQGQYTVIKIKPVER
jgi:Cu/Ag efflux protein CusF